MYHISNAQLVRALDAEREGRPIEPHLRRAIAAIPKVQSPLELEVQHLRRELKKLRATDEYEDFVVTGFEAQGE